MSLRRNFSGGTGVLSLFGLRHRRNNSSSRTTPLVDEQTRIKRQNVLREILDSEQNYVEFLEIMWYKYKRQIIDEGGACFILGDLEHSTSDGGGIGGSKHQDDDRKRQNSLMKRKSLGAILLKRKSISSSALSLSSTGKAHGRSTSVSVSVSGGDDNDSSSNSRRRHNSPRRRLHAMSSNNSKRQSFRSSGSDLGSMFSPESSPRGGSAVNSSNISSRRQSLRAGLEALSSIIQSIGTGSGNSPEKHWMTFPQNAKSILLYHQSFLAKLYERMGHEGGEGGAKSQKPLPAFEMEIGDLILDHFEVSRFGDLYLGYLSTYDHSLKSFIKLRSENKQFARWHDRMKRSEETHSQDLGSLLVMPVQRIPRYLMLIDQLLRVTPETHPDHVRLKQAQQLIAHHAETQNQKIQNQKVSNKRVSTRFRDIVDVENASIPYIHKGQLLKEGGRNKNWKNRWFYLYPTHIQYHDTASSVCKGTISLEGEGVSVLSAEAAGLHNMHNGFLIETPTRVWKCIAVNRLVRWQWIEKIERVIQQNRTARRRGMSNGAENETGGQQVVNTAHHEHLVLYIDPSTAMHNTTNAMEEITESKLLIEKNYSGVMVLAEYPAKVQGAQLVTGSHPVRQFRIIADIIEMSLSVIPHRADTKWHTLQLKTSGGRMHRYCFAEEEDANNCFRQLQQVQLQLLGKSSQ